MNNEIVVHVEALEKYLSEHIEGADLDVHPYEVADLLMNIKKVDEETFTLFLNKLPKELLAEVIIEFPKSDQEDIYERFGAKKLAKLTQELDTDEAADLI